MPTTARMALPYPAATDAPDGPGAFLNLAGALDGKITFAVQGDGITYYWNGTVWRPYESPWTTYTPGYQNANFTFTTRQWRYHAGRVQVRLIATVASNSGNGLNILISSPVNQDTASALCNGRAVIFRGTTRYALAPEFYSTGLVQFFAPSGGAEVPLTTGFPATWAANDQFSALFEYDPA